MNDAEWVVEATFLVSTAEPYTVTFDHVTRTFDVTLGGSDSGDPYITACAGTTDWMRVIGEDCGPYASHEANIEVSTLVCPPDVTCLVDALGFAPVSGYYFMFCSGADAGITLHQAAALVTVGCAVGGRGTAANTWAEYDALCYGGVCAHIGQAA